MLTLSEEKKLLKEIESLKRGLPLLEPIQKAGELVRAEREKKKAFMGELDAKKKIKQDAFNLF